MADGRKILDKAVQIHKMEPDIQLILKTSAPVCSKTLTVLQQAGIVVHPLNPET